MYFAYAMMCLIFGTTFLAIKIGVDAGVPPFIFAGTRFMVAGLLIILTLRLTRQGIRLSRQELQDTAFVGFTMTTVLFATLYWGEQYISSGLAALLAATAPMIVGAVQWKLGSEGLFGCKLTGLCLGLFGVGAAVFPSLKGDGSTESLVALLVILLAQVSYAFGAVRSKQAMLTGVNPYLFNAYQMSFGSIGLILLSALVEPWQNVTLNSDIVGAWFYLTVLGSIVGHSTFYWLVRATNPMFPSTWTYISPIIAQLVGYWWLGEGISFLSFAGLAFVLSGVFLIKRNQEVKVKVAPIPIVNTPELK